MHLAVVAITKDYFRKQHQNVGLTMEMDCVFCAVRTGLYVIQMNVVTPKDNESNVGVP
jgi:hypothetical protein